MPFSTTIYAPPGVYTQSNFENPTAGLLEGLRIPLFIGTGNETLTQNDLELVRGSSANVDQQVVNEDMDGRVVVSVSLAGVYTLGDFNGELTRIRVRKYPIVTGAGRGITATKASSVSVTVNGNPMVVTAIDGTNGVLTLAAAPEEGDVVLVTYFLSRKDTQIIDTLSDQVTEESVTLYGQVGQNYTIVEDDNDTLILTVDDVTTLTVTFPNSGASAWSAAQISAFINAAASSTTLGASTYVNNYGQTVVLLTADGNILIGSGTSNSTLGFTAGDYTSRNKVFYTFNGPIVDGTNGGVTTTDPSDVVVKVDNVQVIPTAVDGTNRAVTLPYAPASGSVVTVQYYFNTWQDTFDYLGHSGVTDITEAGVCPGRSDYTDGVDFVLRNDTSDGTSRIMWGTAVAVTAGEHTTGSTYFNGSQVSNTLVDCQGYLEPCAAVAGSATQFTLPLVPTTGNGRNSPLGSSLFQTVANDRIDIPTDRPDLVLAYWGFGLQDALSRGTVTVLAVDSATRTITLKDAVPTGASVYATMYYNTLIDQEYSVTCVNPGAAGVGTYSVQDEDGDSMLTPKWGTKSSGLATVTVQFPSGSERKPDCRFETPHVTTSYEGPVEEDVTITFAALDSTLAAFTAPGAGDYYFVTGSSDRLRVDIDGSALASGATGINLSAVNGIANLGFAASLVGGEVTYDADSGYTTYDVDATNNGLNLVVDGIVLAGTATPAGGTTLAAYVTALNTAALATKPAYAAATKFVSPTTITLNQYDKLKFHLTGDVAGASGNLTITLTPTPGAYASAAALAAEVDTQVSSAIATLIVAIGAFAGVDVVVTANSSGQMVFTLTKATGDAATFLEFVTGTPEQDFAILAGIDTAATTGGAQTKMIDGPIARRYSIAGDNTSGLLHDRLILRGRLVPGQGSVAPQNVLAQTGITFQGGTGSANVGITPSMTALAGWRGSIMPASILSVCGLAEGQGAAYADARDGQPLVTFYASGGTTSQNNELKFTMDGKAVTVVFTDDAGAAIVTGASADVPLGPALTANTVINQIAAAMAVAGLGASAAAVISAGLIRQEGAGFRLTSALSTSASEITIGSSNANIRLALVSGDVAERTLVDAKVAASALMMHSAAAIADVMTDWTTPTATYFAAEALATIETDASNATYLYIQSQGNAGLGTASIVTFEDATSASAFLYNTGLGIVDGDTAAGEAGTSGYYVTSTSTASGSGTVNTSLFNSGVGQDGVAGQTYRDLVTGLTFTILPREGSADYPAGETVTFTVRATVLTDSNLPVNTIPGVEMVVTNTRGIAVGDSALVETFERGGNEPAVGDVYYVSYDYSKTDFNPKLYTKFANIAKQYGDLNTDSALSLATYLAMLNGAVLVAVKQVAYDTDTNGDGVYDAASETAYRNAIDDVEGAIGGSVYPDNLILLKGDSASLFSYLARHCDIQSDIRHQAERCALCGFAAGTTPRTAGQTATAVERARFRLVYPDMMVVPIPSSDGTDIEELVDGTYLASMMAGAIASPNRDVATPWTHIRLLGASSLARVLDVVEMNTVAQNGITVIESKPPVLRVRHGLTTDMTGNMTKLPTITQIVDETQRQSRATLEAFIGIKFLPGVLSQIEGRLSNTLKGLVDAQILAAYTGVKANISETDATMCEVEAAIAPVFPLLYILVTFAVRSSLGT